MLYTRGVGTSRRGAVDRGARIGVFGSTSERLLEWVDFEVEFGRLGSDGRALWVVGWRGQH